MFNQTCGSGDTRFFVTPINQLGYVTRLHVDTAFASGLFGTIQVQVRDVFQALSGSSGSVLRFQTQVLAGDVVDLDPDGAIEVFGGVDVRVNYSGPIVSMSAAFR